MVSLLFSDDTPAIVNFNPRLFENQRRGVVFAPNSNLDDNVYIRTPDGEPYHGFSVSIVICTLDRPESLNDTLESLTAQTFKDFEVILITQKGDLSKLRDDGLKVAGGDIVTFIDDDVYCPPAWLQGVVESFREGVVGVTGPTYISREYQPNRDSLKYKKLRKLQEWLFKVPSDPATLSACGAPSMASNFAECSYEGDVRYLECCNMSVKKKEAIDAGGFDHNYSRTGEWCEVDLALRLGKRGGLRFSRQCALYHRPSQAGVYRHRLSTAHRWENFKRFQNTWIKKSLRRHLYWAFVWTYFKVKSFGWI